MSSNTLSPAVNAIKDIGTPDQRWHRIWFSYFIDGWNYWSVSDLVSKSRDLFQVEGERAYLVARNRTYVGVVIGEGSLPPVAGHNLFLKVIEGEWGSGQSDYTLPPVINEGDWLGVDRGVWRSIVVNFTSPPEAEDIDEGYILAVQDGEWVKFDGDNFYLPAAFCITPEVRHAVTVSGYRWLKRPLDTVSGVRDGLIRISGDAGHALRGDGGWVDGSGDDYGHHETGDIRKASRVGGQGYVACAGQTVGKTGELNNAMFFGLFKVLNPTGDWDTDTATIPNMPGYEIMFSSASKHPVNLVVPVGPEDKAPYTVELRSSPSGAVQYSSTSGGPDWFTRDGMMFCDMSGKTLEHYAGYAVTETQPASSLLGYYYADVTDKDGTIRTDTISITEEDVMRMDTAVVAGNFPSGCGPRAASYRYQMMMVNGRPIHAPFYVESKGESGTAVVNKGLGPGAQTLRGSDLFIYGFGDHRDPTVVAPDIKVAQLLNQLKDLDSPNELRDPPRYYKHALPFDSPRGAWWGGCLGRDGKIYFAPHNADCVLVVDPKYLHDPATDPEGTYVRNGISRWGKLGNAKFKWAGGVAADDGRIFFMPFDATDFLIVDTVRRRLYREDFGLGYDLKDVRFVGATLTPENRIVAMSVTGYKELEIDLNTGTARLYDMEMAMRQIISVSGASEVILKEEHPVKFYKEPEYEPGDDDYIPEAWPDTMNMGYDRIELPFLPSATQWGGTFLHASGGVGAVPCGHWTPEISIFGQPVAPGNDEDIPKDRKLMYWSLYGKQASASVDADSNSFGGGLAGDTATMLSEIYRCSNYALDETRYNMPKYYGEYALRGRCHLSHSRTKFMGGVMAADGCNYLLPCGGYHPCVMVIGHAPTVYGSNTFPVSSFRVSEQRYLHCRGGALGPDGCIYSATADGTAFFALNPRTRRVITVETDHQKLPHGYTAWMGCVSGPDGWMYFPPFDSKYILIADPCVPCGKWPGELSNYINKF